VKKNYACPLFFAALFFFLLSLPACKQPEGPAEETETYTPDISGWTSASWSPFTAADSIKGFAWGSGVYTAVGRNGAVAYSYDGDIWKRGRKLQSPDPKKPFQDPFELPGGGSANFNAVAFGGGLFIAVAEGGHLAYSRDGAAWAGKHEAGGFGTEHINGVAYGENTAGAGSIVAVGNNGNISAAFPSGPESWAGGRVTGFSAIKDITFGGGKFYAAGDNGWMGWAVPPENFSPAHEWDWHPRQWTFSAPTGTFSPFVKKIAFGEYGRGTPGLGITFNEWGGKRAAVCAADRFESGDTAAWDSDIDAGFFGQELNGIVWSPRTNGTWLAAGTSAMIGYWPSSDPADQTGRYWLALSFAEFRWWEITALAALNGGYFAGGIGGKIGYRK
jgi:hypothetical protein